MNLYKEYIKERENKEIIVIDQGFVTFEIVKPYIYLCDMYVRKEDRQLGYADILEGAVMLAGKTNDCDEILTSASLDADDFSMNKHVIRKRKYKFFKLDKPTKMVYFSKEL